MCPERQLYGAMEGSIVMTDTDVSISNGSVAVAYAMPRACRGVPRQIACPGMFGV